MTTSEKYVTAAYLAIFVLLLAYVLIIALKLSRLEREVAELERLARARIAPEPPRKAVAVG